MKRPVHHRCLFGFLGIVLLAVSVSLDSPLYASDRDETEPTPYPFNIHYVLVNTEFTLLHELGHALISELKIPVLGREEDAADQLATLLLVNYQGDGFGDTLIQKIDSVGLELRIEADEDTIVFWDSHPPPIQRLYNLLCLVYGLNPDPSAKYLENNWLPIERGWYCDQEYKQALRAMAWISRQYGYPDRTSPAEAGHAPEVQRPPPPISAGLQQETIEKVPDEKKHGNIVVNYGIPTTPNGKLLLKQLKTSSFVERLAKHVEHSFSLPRDLIISFSNCGDDAYWNERSGEVVVCYRLLDLYYEHAVKAKNMQKILLEKSGPLILVLPTQIFEALKDRATNDGADLNDIAVDALKNYLKSSPKSKNPTRNK